MISNLSSKTFVDKLYRAVASYLSRSFKSSP